LDKVTVSSVQVCFEESSTLNRDEEIHHRYMRVPLPDWSMPLNWLWHW